MKLIEKYLNKIDLENIKICGGFNYLNPFIKDVALKNVNELSFNSLYPNIICGIVEAGLHNNLKDVEPPPGFPTTSGIIKKLVEFKEKFEAFQRNRVDLKKNSPYRYAEIKAEINKFYGELYYMFPNDKKNYAFIVTEYLKNYYEDLLECNPNTILYIDTDTIYYTGEINLLDFNIPFEIENIDYIMFSDKKKYAMSKNNIMVTKGYHKNKGAQDAIIFLKKHIRNDKLEDLLKDQEI